MLAKLKEINAGRQEGGWDPSEEAVKRYGYGDRVSVGVTEGGLESTRPVHRREIVRARVARTSDGDKVAEPLGGEG